MKVLITGSTGFVGKNLSNFLSQKGHELHFLSRGDFQSISLPKVDAIIHLSGENIAKKRWTKSQKKKILESRQDTTQKLVNAIRQTSTPPKVIISASAVGIYGDRGDELLTENASTEGTDFLNLVCSEWESPLRQLSDSTRAIALRIGPVLGANGGMLSELIPLFKKGFGSYLGNGKQWMSWIHVTDLLNLIHWAIHNPEAQGPLNAVSPNPVTNRDFTDEIARQLSKPVFFSAPSWALKIILGERASFLLNSGKAFPKKALDLGFEFKFPRLEGALMDILK